MGLLAVTGVCALVALVGLVFLVIYSIQMDANMSKVKELSGKIATINKKRPVPVEGNKKPIQEDIEVYENASRELQKLFGRPLAPATELFFNVLTLKKSMWLPEGIDENDEVMARLNQLAGEHQFASLHNGEFEGFLDLIAAETLLKKVKELAADEEKAKQVLELIPDLNGGADDVLANRIVAAAKLDGLLQSEVSVADLVRLIKALPAGSAAVKRADSLRPGIAALGEADLAKLISGSRGLEKLLQESDSAAEFAAQFKSLPADDEKAKLVLSLIPDAAKLGDDELAKSIAAAADLGRRLREIVFSDALARRVKSAAADDEAVKYVRTLIPNASRLGEADLADRIAADSKLDRKLRELVPDSDPETLKRLREIPEKFSADQFLEAYNKIMEGVDEKNYADQRTRFDDFRRDKFENWSTAREAFINAVGNRNGAGKSGPCIVEKLDSENADEVLLAALGVPRRMSGESSNLKRLMNNIVGQLTKEYQVTLVGKALGLGITSISTGMNNDAPAEGDVQSINPDDYPSVATHLDIISYMLYRIGASGVAIWDVQIRMKAAEGGDGVTAGMRFNDSKEQRDGFDVYHYTLEFSGTMAQIRDAVSRLDNCYDVRRVYLVRNIALYAENNIVDSVFTGMRVENRPQAALDNAPAVSTGRRRRPRSGNVAAQEMNDTGDDAGARLAAQKKLDEEYERRQQQLDVDKRDGYGETIAGGDKDTFRAVIDVEYVVKPAK